MTKASSSAKGQSYLFSVDILVKGNTNGEALEKLLSNLNAAGYADYRVQSGIALGQTIEKELKNAASKQPIPLETFDALDTRIRDYIRTSRLIRLTVLKPNGVSLSVPCRVVNFDPDNELLTVYHVDEKSVYTFKLNEIEDFAE